MSKKSKTGPHSESNSERVAPLGDAIDSFFQLLEPEEWRIELPELTSDQACDPAISETSQSENPFSDKALAQLITCLWYLKTKIFRRQWSDDSGDDDARTRRALHRISSAADILRANGVEIKDPVGERYPEGGEYMMRPVQFTTAEDVDYPTVAETIEPIIYRNGKMIQRAQVFVSTPHNNIQESHASSINEDNQTDDPSDGPMGGASRNQHKEHEAVNRQSERRPRERFDGINANDELASKVDPSDNKNENQSAPKPGGDDVE